MIIVFNKLSGAVYIMVHSQVDYSLGYWDIMMGVGWDFKRDPSLSPTEIAICKNVPLLLLELLDSVII